MPAAGSSCHLYLGVMSRARSVRFVLAERDVPVVFWWSTPESATFGAQRARARRRNSPSSRTGELAALEDGPGVAGTPGPFHSTAPRWWPLVQYPCPLADGQSDPWAVFDGVFEYRARPSKAIARIEQAVDLRPVPRPLLNFVEVAVVGIARAVRFLVEINVVGLRIGHGSMIARLDAPWRPRWAVWQRSVAPHCA